MIIDSIVSNIDTKRPDSAGRVTQSMNTLGGISLKFSDDSIKSLFFPELSSGYDVRRSGVVVGAGMSNAIAAANAVALNNAFDIAANLGLPAILPPGVIEYAPNSAANRLNTTTSIYGYGKETQLVNTNPAGATTYAALFVNASNVTISNFYMKQQFVAGNRIENNCAIKAQPTQGSTYQNIQVLNMWFEDINGAVVLLKHVVNSRVSGIWARRSGADVVHITGLSDGVSIDTVYAEQAGDDTVAVVGYQSGGAIGKPKNININNVYSRDTWHGRGVTVVGGENVQASNIFVSNCSGAGIAIHSEQEYDTYGNNNVTFSNVYIESSGEAGVIASVSIVGRSTNTNSKVTLRNISIRGGRFRGINVSQTTDLVIDGFSVDTNVDAAMWLGAVTNATIKNGTFYNNPGTAVYLTACNFIKINDLDVTNAVSAAVAIGVAAYNAPSTNITIDGLRTDTCGSNSSMATVNISGSSTNRHSNIRVGGVLRNNRWRALSAVYADNITAANLIVQGNTASQGIWFGNTTNIVLRNVLLTSISGVGIFFENTNGGTLTLDGIEGQNVNANSESSPGWFIRANPNVGNTAYFTRVFIDNINLSAQTTTVGSTLSVPNHAGVTTLGTKLYSVRDTVQSVEPFDVGIATTAVPLTDGGNPIVSPLIYNNTSPRNLWFKVAGGTITATAVSFDGTTWSSLGKLNGLFLLQPGQQIRVTFTTIPTQALVKPTTLL